jgi:hypothetical protein
VRLERAVYRDAVGGEHDCVTGEGRHHLPDGSEPIGAVAPSREVATIGRWRRVCCQRRTEVGSSTSTQAHSFFRDGFRKAYRVRKSQKEASRLADRRNPNGVDPRQDISRHQRAQVPGVKASLRRCKEPNIIAL